MNARLWDTELYDLLNQLAYERAHHAGKDEVEAEFTGLLNDFVSINERLNEILQIKIGRLEAENKELHQTIMKIHEEYRPEVQDAERYRWRPIDEAPQDGTLLLLGWMRDWPVVEWECEVNAAGNLDTGRPGTRHMHGYATHWMPLPDSPQTRGE